jgi:hypothetical protein
VTFGFSLAGVLMVAIGHRRICAASSRDALLARSFVFHFGGGHAMRSHQVAPSQAIIGGASSEASRLGSSGPEKLAKCQCLCLVIEFGMQCHDARSVLVERKPRAVILL